MKLKKYPHIKDILFLKGDINYTEFHLVNGGKMVSSYTLKKHQGTLQGFLRVSKNHLVNPRFIINVKVEGNYAELMMKDGIFLKVSRRRINLVKNSISII